MKRYKFDRIDTLPNSKDAKIRKIQSYPKILAVAHPLDRVMLTYKAMRNTPKYFRQNDRAHFQEFLDILTTSDIIDQSGWISVNDACLPCVVAYDFIVRAETMDMDLINLLQTLKANDNMNSVIDMIKRDVVFQETSKLHGSKLPHHYDEYQGINKTTLDKLHNAYNLDIRLFNYEQLLVNPT